MTSATDLPSSSIPAPASGGRMQLLRGTRVLDLTTSLAGPYGAMLLADLGAEVIKIERPGIGDDSRHWMPPALGGMALWFTSVNRNKRSLTLDYAQSEGYEVLSELIRVCDVVIVNHVPKVQEKLRISYRHLKEIRNDIVFVSLTGFGMDGARCNLPGYDLIAEGYSGVMDLTGELDGEPQKVGTPAADLLGGADAALGCLAALLNRKVTGQGHQVDVALVDSMTRFMTPRLVSYMGSGELPRRSGGKDSVIAIYQVFQTADAPITLALANNNTWSRFCRVVSRADLLNDAALQDNAGRIARRGELVAVIADILKTEKAAHWLNLFSREGVPAGPINRLDHVASDVELHKRGLLFAIEQDGHRFPQVGLGIRFDGKSAGYDLGPPKLGQHSGEVLADLLGMAAGRIEELKQKGLV